jgi:hypothetical protein
MATVLEDCTAEGQRSVVLFCGQKDSVHRIFTNKCFLFTVGSVCRAKRFIAGLNNFLTGRRLLCCGFQSTGKAMEQVYQCWWRICREYDMFYVLYLFVAYLLTLPHIRCCCYVDHIPLILAGERQGSTSGDGATACSKVDDL